MWTHNIIETILYDCLSSTVFSGVYAIDTLPVQVKHPAALIINLSPSNSGGSHWVCVYINEKRIGDYFDSLGNSPPRPIVKFLQRNCKYYYVNSVQYQHDQSVLCGLFCIVYIYFKVRNQNVLNKFHKTNLKQNDHLVLNYVRKIKAKNKKCK